MHYSYPDQVLVAVIKIAGNKTSDKCKQENHKGYMQMADTADQRSEKDGYHIMGIAHKALKGALNYTAGNKFLDKTMKYEQEKK